MTDQGLDYGRMDVSHTVAKPEHEFSKADKLSTRCGREPSGQ